jgi:putative nucleotidyltransferase with HDIG domain
MLVSEHAPRHIYTGASVVFIAGLASLVVAFRDFPIAAPVPVAILAIAAILAELTAVELPRGGSTSLAFPLSIAASILAGPSAAGLVAVCTAVGLNDFQPDRPKYKILFNFGQLSLSAVASGYAYVYLGGRVFYQAGGPALPFRSADFPAALLPLLALGIVAFSVNTALLSYVLSTERGISPLAVWTSGLAWAFPMQVALTFLGASVAQVMSIELFALALFFFPLVLSRQVYLRYINLKEAYLDTVRSLVGTIEAKDRYTRGHSDRVASLSERIASSMGMSETQVESVRIAAQLHDLGKVAMADSILQKTGKLTASEIDQIRTHPAVGAQIVEKVPALRELAPVVRHHHERYDGTGYGEGLARDAIPLEARILAVADSFDAMTTARSYRPAMPVAEAIDEMVACSGDQFDPVIVGHLFKVLDVDEPPL